MIIEERAPRARRIGTATLVALMTLLAVSTFATASPRQRAAETLARGEAAEASIAGVSTLGEMGSVDAVRIRSAVSWLNGLASGLILPTDVTVRLRQQDARLAKDVMGAWKVLARGSGGLSAR